MVPYCGKLNDKKIMMRKVITMKMGNRIILRVSFCVHDGCIEAILSYITLHSTSSQVHKHQQNPQEFVCDLVGQRSKDRSSPKVVVTKG